MKYHKIHFTVFQYFLLGLSRNILTTPTICALSGLVHTMEYIKLPTTEIYVMIFISSISFSVEELYCELNLK